MLCPLLNKQDKNTGLKKSGICLQPKRHPKRIQKRFFYFEDVTEQDNLFLETMKCLYPGETTFVETSTIRKNKKYFLEKFRSDGFYLIDSLDSPFEEE